MTKIERDFFEKFEKLQKRRKITKNYGKLPKKFKK